MPRVVTFGEIMLRLSPPGFERFLQSPALQATFGGGEANVAVSLAHFGCESWFVTKLPAHAIGDAAVRALRAEGVRTDAIVRGGDRARHLLRGSRREPARVDGHLRSRAFGDRGDGARRGRLGARARRRGVAPRHGHHARTRITGGRGHARGDRGGARGRAQVSIDLNFRKKLWSEKQAQDVMRPIADGVDVVIANEEDLQAVLGIPVENAEITGGRLDLGGYQSAAEQVARDFRVCDGRHHAAREPVGQ